MHRYLCAEKCQLRAQVRQLTGTGPFFDTLALAGRAFAEFVFASAPENAPNNHHPPAPNMNTTPLLLLLLGRLRSVTVAEKEALF